MLDNRRLSASLGVAERPPLSFTSDDPTVVSSNLLRAQPVSRYSRRRPLPGWMCSALFLDQYNNQFFLLSVHVCARRPPLSSSFYKNRDEVYGGSALSWETMGLDARSSSSLSSSSGALVFSNFLSL